HRRFHTQGIAAAAFHPGIVATSFGASSDSFFKRLYTTSLARAFMVTPEKGADQLVWLADGTPGVDWVSGTYYEKRKPARTHSQAMDEDLARQFWERTLQLLGLDRPEPNPAS